MFVWVFAGVVECIGVYEKFYFRKNFGRPWRGRGGGFWRNSDNPGQTGKGGSENHDFGRTSFVNAPFTSLDKTKHCQMNVTRPFLIQITEAVQIENVGGRELMNTRLVRNGA